MLRSSLVAIAVAFSLQLRCPHYPPAGLEVEQISLLTRKEYATMTSSQSLPLPPTNFYRFDSGPSQQLRRHRRPSKPPGLCLITILHPPASGGPAAAASQILLTRECDPNLVASSFVHSFMPGDANSQRCYEVLASRMRGEDGDVPRSERRGVNTVH